MLSSHEIVSENLSYKQSQITYIEKIINGICFHSCGKPKGGMQHITPSHVDIFCFWRQNFKTRLLGQVKHIYIYIYIDIVYIVFSPPCKLWLTTRRCWWPICGTLLGRKEDGSLALLDLSMIENWMRSSLFSIAFKESKLL